MRAPRLLALDLDGTLLAPEGSLNRRTASLLRLARSGTILVLATSRDFALTRPVATVVGAEHCICLTGAQAFRAERCLFRHPLPAAPSQAVFRYATRLGLSAAWYVRKEVFQSPREEAPDQLLLRGDPALLHRVAERFGSLQGQVRFLFLPDWTHPQVLHLLHPRATKGRALERLAGFLGVAREAILAVGDGLADIDMLELAGHGVAMEGSPPPVREAADQVLEEPLEDFLQRLS